MRLKIYPQVGRDAAIVARCALSIFPICHGVLLMEENDIKEHSLHRRASSLFRGRGCAEKCRKERAAGCVTFLAQAMQLAQNTSSAFVERRSVKFIQLCVVSNVLVCGSDQKWPFLWPGREQGSIAEVRDAKHPRTRLLPIHILNNMRNIWVVEGKTLPLVYSADVLESNYRIESRANQCYRQCPPFGQRERTHKALSRT